MQMQSKTNPFVSGNENPDQDVEMQEQEKQRASEEQKQAGKRVSAPGRNSRQRDRGRKYVSGSLKRQKKKEKGDQSLRNILGDDFNSDLANN